jgi:hypothetical protein
MTDADFALSMSVWDHSATQHFVSLGPPTRACRHRGLAI